MWPWRWEAPLTWRTWGTAIRAAAGPTRRARGVVGPSPPCVGKSASGPVSRDLGHTPHLREPGHSGSLPPLRSTACYVLVKRHLCYTTIQIKAAPIYEGRIMRYKIVLQK